MAVDEVLLTSNVNSVELKVPYEVVRTTAGTISERVHYTFEPVENITGRTSLGKMVLIKIGSKKDRMEVDVLVETTEEVEHVSEVGS